MRNLQEGIHVCELSFKRIRQCHLQMYSLALALSSLIN